MLSAGFAFQLLLAGVRATCVMPVGGVATTRASNDGAMAAMQMADIPVAPAGRQETAPSSGSDSDVPCEQSTTPAACRLMAPCTGAFLVLATLVDADAVRPSARVAPLTIAIPASRTTTPELPPPRA